MATKIPRAWHCLVAVAVVGFVNFVYGGASADQGVSCRSFRAEQPCNSHSEYDCGWNTNINQCLCNIQNVDAEIQIIAMIEDPETQLSKAVSSILPRVVSIEQAISRFRRNHNRARKASHTHRKLVIFGGHTVTNVSAIPLTQRMTLNSLTTKQNKTPIHYTHEKHIHVQQQYKHQHRPDVDIVLASNQDTAALLADLFCEIHEQFLPQPARKLLSLQSSYDKLCCRCLTTTTESGCTVDPLCETHVCRTDRLCCDDDAFGWDDLCVSVASDLCKNDGEELPSYSDQECFEIESESECNHAYYTQQLGCYWNNFDESCMCKIQEDSVELVYLVDISDSIGNAQHFAHVAHLLDEIQTSTLYDNSDHHANYILYDENDYELGPLSDATVVDIDRFPRTALVNMNNAIQAAVKYFRALNTDKQRILVMTNAQNERHYEDEEASFCALRNMLQEQQISVITLSYTLDEEGTPLNLQCIADITNTISYSDILHADATEWDVFPIAAKLSSDICQLSRSESLPKTLTASPKTLTTSPSPTPTSKPSSAPSPNPTITATTTTLSIVAAPASTVNPTPSPTQTTTTTSTPTTAPTTMPIEEETACVLQTNYEFVILADSSCGVSGDNCLTQLQMIGDLLASLKQDGLTPPTGNPLVSYIEYSQSAAQVVVSLSDTQYQQSVDAFIAKIESDGACAQRSGNIFPLKTDLVSGLEMAMHELLNNGNPGHAVQKIITVNNCQNTERTEELCGAILNDIYQHDISVYSINIAAAGAFHRHNVISNPSHYPLCEQIRHVCSGSYAWYHIDAESVRDAIEECLQPICSLPSSPVFSPNLDAPEVVTDKSTAESTSTPTSKPTAKTTTAEPTSFPTPQPTRKPSLSPTTTPSVNRKCNIDDTNWNLQFSSSTEIITTGVAPRSILESSSSSSASVSESVDGTDGKLDIYSLSPFGVRNWRSRQILAYCYEYLLDISDSNENKCFGDASDIQRWMIEIPQKCGAQNDELLHRLQDVLYWDDMSNVDLIHDTASDTIGFGKIYSSSQESSKPEIGSKLTFSVCFKYSEQLNYHSMINTVYSIYGGNDYYTSGQSVEMLDFCSLIAPPNNNEVLADVDQIRVGWDG